VTLHAPTEGHFMANESRRYAKAATNKSATASAMFGRLIPRLKVSAPSILRFQPPYGKKCSDKPMREVSHKLRHNFNNQRQAEPQNGCFTQNPNEKTTS
jgi:hypothetical protein